MAPEEVEALFTRSSGEYLFARWGRPIAPVVFGVEEATLQVVKGALEAVVALAGHQLAETDPELGSNLMVFFFREWKELTEVPHMEQLVPDLGPLPLWKRVIAAYFIIDITYAASALDYAKHPSESPAQKFGYFMGVMTPVCPLWYLCTIFGAVVGASIPSQSGLDFALPIAFIAMVIPALNTKAHKGAALAACALAFGLVWLPFNLGLIAAALGGMAVGAEIERRGLQ